MNLAEMTAEVERVNRDLGWHDVDVSFGDLIALAHSELSEALEAFRDHGLGDMTGIYSACSGNPKPEGVGSELTDVLIRLLDMCGRYGIDLESEYRRKVDFNKTRPYRHGGKRI